MCITLHQYKVFLNLFRNTEDLEIPLFDKLIYRYRYHPCYRDKLLVHAQSHRYCPHLFVLVSHIAIALTCSFLLSLLDLLHSETYGMRTY